MILGIGIDVVEIARLARLVESKGERALARLFTDAERAYATSHAEPIRNFAARVAAKEAAFKALAGNDLARAIGWRELEVISKTEHAPEMRLHGRALERAKELGATRVHVSITHTPLTAAAFVIAEGAD